MLLLLYKSLFSGVGDRTSGTRLQIPFAIYQVLQVIRNLYLGDLVSSERSSSPSSGSAGSAAALHSAFATSMFRSLCGAPSP